MRSIAVSALTILSVGCAAVGPTESDAPIVVAGESRAAFASFDSVMIGLMREYHVPNASVAVSRDGEVLYSRAYTLGPTDAEPTAQPGSLFRIASISKPVTAVAVLKLVEDGALSLSDRVSDHLQLDPPPGQSPDPHLNDVTIRNLLEHLGGWDRDESFDPMFRDRVIAESLELELPIERSDIMHYMNGVDLDHTPGTEYAYSNYGYLLLGRVIEAVSGTDYESYVRNTILAPLGATGMRLGRTLPADRQSTEVAYFDDRSASSVFSEGDGRVPHPYGAWNLENMDAHGGWIASAEDLVRFASSFDDPTTNPVLSEASIRQMFALPEYQDPDTYDAGDAYYALGWSVRDWGEEGMNTWHGGSLPGTQSFMVRRRDGFGWAALFNRNLPLGEIDRRLHVAANAVGM